METDDCAIFAARSWVRDGDSVRAPANSGNQAQARKFKENMTFSQLSGLVHSLQDAPAAVAELAAK